jgi:hypothetical protein
MIDHMASLYQAEASVDHVEAVCLKCGETFAGTLADVQAWYLKHLGLPPAVVH